MDLPPIKLEVLRLGLNGEPKSALCRPATPGQLSTSLEGHVLCLQADRITIVEPPIQPAAPPVAPPPPPTL
jgi:hypothetical protein